MTEADGTQDELLTVEDVAKLLKIHPNSVYEKVASKSLPGAFRLGDHDNAPIRFSKRVLLAWIANEATAP